MGPGGPGVETVANTVDYPISYSGWSHARCRSYRISLLPTRFQLPSRPRRRVMARRMERASFSRVLLLLR